MKNEVGCFVINLEKDVDRRENISRQLAKAGIPYQIFSAVYGKYLTPEELAQHYNKSRAIELSHDLTPSEIGCALSHVFIYRKMLDEGMSYALVLEDDAQLSQDLPAVLSGLQREYASSEPVVFLLNHVRKYKNRKTRRLDEKYLVADIYGTPIRASGYFITRAAAKLLLDNLYPVWAVADDWAVFNRDYATIKAVVPYCVGLSEHAQFSNLESERQAIQLKRSIGYHLYQLFYHKFINQLFVRPFQRVSKQDESW